MWWLLFAVALAACEQADRVASRVSALGGEAGTTDGLDPKDLWFCSQTQLRGVTSDHPKVSLPFECDGEDSTELSDRMNANAYKQPPIYGERSVLDPLNGTALVRVLDAWRGAIARVTPDGLQEPRVEYLDTGCNNVSGFLIHPATRDIYYSCEGVREIRVLGGDAVALPESLIELLAIGFDGSWLYKCSVDVYLGYCLRTADGKERVVVESSPGSPPSVQQIRAAAKGFMLLQNAEDGITRWSIGYDGRVGLDDVYAPLPTSTQPVKCGMWANGDAACVDWKENIIHVLPHDEHTVTTRPGLGRGRFVSGP